MLIKDIPDTNLQVFSSKDLKKGIKDMKGNVLLSAIYDEVEIYNESNLACLYKDGASGFINLKTKEKTDIIFDSVTMGLEDDLIRINHNKKIGYMNKDGKIVLPIKYGLNSENFVDGICLVEENGKFNIINKEGKILIKDVSFCTSVLSKGYVAVRYNDDYENFKLYKKDKLLSNKEYNECCSFINNRFSVRKDGLCGFLDENGNEVIPCKYITASDFNEEGFACVKYKESIYLIDKFGYIIKDFKDEFSSFYYSCDGIWVGIKHDDRLPPAEELHSRKSRYFNNKGESITEKSYDYCPNFQNGYGVLYSNNENNEKEVTIINKTGKVLFKIDDLNKLRPIGDYDAYSVSIKNNYASICIANKRSFVNLLDDNPHAIKFENVILNIGSRDDDLFYTVYNDDYLLATGCFIGNLKQFEEEVVATHLHNKNYFDEYAKIIRELKCSKKKSKMI